MGNHTVIRLEFCIVTELDLSGLYFYVKEGELFDVSDYADAYRINPCDVDAQDVRSAEDAAGRLNPGEWLQVSHGFEPAY